MTTDQWIGTAGVSLILIAYFCSSFGWLDGKGKPYFALNTVGAALACLASVMISYWPFVILEGVWTIVSLVALIKTSRSRATV